MNKLVLFSASKDQNKYFNKLIKHVALPIGLVNYKKLWRLSLNITFPIDELNKQVAILVRRKQNSSKGRGKSDIFWLFFQWLNREKAKLLYRQYQAWLKHEPAEYIGVWNGKKFRQAVLVLAAKSLKKQIVYFETGPLPGYSVIDPVGVDYFSAIPRNAKFYLSRPLKSHKQTSSELTFQKPVGLPENFIFVPFQVVEDSNIYLHSPWVQDMRQLYEILVIAAESNPDLSFVIKPHPACTENYHDLEQRQHPQIYFIHNAPSQALVQHADAVLTVNSTVGMEAIIARKKVIVLGQAIYGFESLARPVVNQNALNKTLNNLADWKLDEELLEHFLDYLANDYAIPGDGMLSTSQEHWKVVHTKLSLIIKGQGLAAIGLTKDDVCIG